VPVNSNNRWTAEDDKRLLKLLAARKSSFSIAAQLRRSIQAIRARLGILKAKERFAGSSGETRSTPGTKRWTLDDDRRLMELKAKGTSYIEIANTLGRTEAAIKGRAHTLKGKVASQAALANAARRV
jgi:hypothetical protein